MSPTFKWFCVLTMVIGILIPTKVCHAGPPDKIAELAMLRAAEESYGFLMAAYRVAADNWLIAKTAGDTTTARELAGAMDLLAKQVFTQKDTMNRLGPKY